DKDKGGFDVYSPRPTAKNADGRGDRPGEKRDGLPSDPRAEAPAGPGGGSGKGKEDPKPPAPPPVKEKPKSPVVWHRDASRPTFARVYVGDRNSLELVSLHVSVTIDG